ncbi:hypothetical protein B0H19DRAFT_1258362 [Mycena capillaripes]|nr:hypothetical protein B0H19DRAFT_1258362 [Mycena capillaripes]
MSKADYAVAKAEFQKAVDMGRQLVRLKVGSESRISQLSDITNSAHRLAPLQSYVLNEGEGPLWQDCFTGRDYTNELLNPDKKANFSLPAGYEVLRNVTKLIQSNRAKNKAPTPAAPSKSKKNTRSVTKKSSAHADDSGEDDVVITGDSSAPVGDEASVSLSIQLAILNSLPADVQMNVDDGAPESRPDQKATPGPPANKARKTFKEGGRAPSPGPQKPNAPSASSKRPRLDGINTPFHEDSFLTAAVAEFYVYSSNVEPLINETESITGMSTDFLHNSLAMRKRLYYIMVEMACIHEQCRSLLLRRNQLVDEGEFISNHLQSQPNNPGAGLDTMVP